MTPPSSSADERDATPTGPEQPNQQDPRITDITDTRKCPTCLYELRGLPTRHTCPECGCEYDEHSRVWEVPRWWRIAASVVFASTQLVGASVLLVLVSLFSTTSSWIRWPLFLLYLGFIAFLSNALWHPQFIAVSPAGVIDRQWWGRTRKIPWSKIHSFRFWKRGMLPFAILYYYSGNRKRMLDCRRALISETDREQFAQSIEEGKRRYAE